MGLGRSIRIGAALTVVGVIAALLGAAAASASGGGVTRVRVAGDDQNTRVVVELDARTRGRLVQTPNGDQRLILALADVGVSGDRSGVGGGLVSSWSLQGAGNEARLELSLSDNARVVRRFLLPPSDGIGSYRYVVDLAPQPSGIDALLAATAIPAVQTLFSPTRAAPEPVQASALRPRNVRPVVVIDAGHGGHDPGALGVSRREKDLTLAAALALRDRLQRGGRYRVVLTRDRDVFIPLEGRLSRARRAHADLFISLHADAGQDPAARGASVYTLSDSGSNRAARRAMSSDGWFASPSATDASVTQILFDLTQRATVNQSASFAEMLLASVREQAVVRSSAHRNAGFYVLLAPDVPAVLLEMGFVTNVEDEQALSDPASVRRMMGAVGDSIDRYFGRDQLIAAM